MKVHTPRPVPAVVAEVLAGPHAVLEALRARRRRLHRILLARQDRSGITATILELAQASGLRVEVLPRAELDRLAKGAAHQGVVAEGEAFPYAPAEAMVAQALRGSEGAFLVALDGIQDPQNLGAIVRTVDAAGTHGLILPRDRAVGVTPAVVRASAGATEHIPVARVTNLAAFLGWVKTAGVWVVGADPAAPHTLDGVDLTVPLVLVIGGEGRGLRPLIKSRCDILVRIPVGGKVASLNASAAAAICLFEVVRQRHEAKKRFGLTGCLEIE